MTGPALIERPTLHFEGGTAVLDTPLVYLDAMQRQWFVPSGFRCDFESIPTWIPALVQWALGDGLSTAYAGVLHDWLYRTGIVPKGEADRVYYEILGLLDQRKAEVRVPYFGWKILSLPVGSIANWTKWAGVYFGGWGAWWKNASRREARA